MLPYPSGKIHVGHVRNYLLGDVIARIKWRQGYNVLHPIGWDALGLPAENAALQHKVEPHDWTWDNINYMRGQLRRLGISYDWTREVATCEPEYYRWNQWFFIRLYERGLAYRKKGSVNWCPSCQTVLANEQVIDGRCWRCDSQVIVDELEQWYFKITDYVDRLLGALDELNGWPEKVLTMQRNWIGKSKGAYVDFGIQSRSEKIRVFTTRIVYEQHPRFLSDALWTTRYAAGYLLVIDGMFHLFAFNDHLDHPFNAAVFGIVAPVQIAAGIALPRFRTLDWAWLLLTIGLIGAYVATRVTVVWPLDEIEEVDLLGVTSKFVEAATLVALAPLLRGGQKEPTASTTPTAKS